MAVDIIRISHLVKEFKTANGVVHALDDVNLSIRHGEIYGIIGLRQVDAGPLYQLFGAPHLGRCVF